MLDATATGKLQQLPESCNSCRKAATGTQKLNNYLNAARERENYADKGGNPFLHMLRESTWSYMRVMV